MSGHRSELSDAESAIAVVRIVLAMVGAAVILGGRTASTTDWLSAGVYAFLALGTGVLLSALVLRLYRVFGTENGFLAVVVQILDTIAALALAGAVSQVIEDPAWALLVIPIVTGSLRLGAYGVLGVWALTSCGYFAMLAMDYMQPGSDALTSRVVFERPGALLAVTVCVALLTRWLQEGWTAQASLTAEASERLGHVRVIERAGRAAGGRSPQEILKDAAGHLLELGYEAASCHDANGARFAVGSGVIIPTDETPQAPEGRGAVVTAWNGPAGRVYSVSVVERRSGTLVTGWSRSEPPESRVVALADLIAHTSNIIETAELLRRVRHEADHDPLTRLANRSLADRHLADRAARPEPVALALIDLDHFKAINDTYGHQVGDVVLAAVGSQLRAVVPPGGLGARYGGDEFVIIVSGPAALQVTEVIEELRRRTHTPLAARGVVVDVRFSIGIALADGATTADALYQLADRMLYSVKEAGRNGYRAGWVEAAPAPTVSPLAAMVPPDASALVHERSGPVSSFFS